MRRLQALLAGFVALSAALSAVLPPAPASAEERPFVYGITIADPSSQTGGTFDLARKAGFTHVYAQLLWEQLEPARGQYAWFSGRDNLLDRLLDGARQHGIKLILRLDRPPSWAGGSAKNVDLSALRAFSQAVAERSKGVATAYEVFNEPNLPFEFGGAPSPSRYVQVLEAAYQGVKAADSSATVISAGMAPNTGGLNGTLEDVDFLRGIYAAGGQRFFDALGIHPYGGNTAPESGSASCGICFRRAELYRQLMVEQGDAARPIWITEFGYLHTTSVDLGEYNWLKLSAQQQGDYLARAFSYGYRSWPWLQGMVVFNLDFSTVGWTGQRSGMYWFALLNEDRSPRAAYTALAAMPKPGAAYAGAQPLQNSNPTTSSSTTSSATTGAATQTAPVSSPSGGTVCTTSGRVAVCRSAGS